jgi:hypothetical protein
MGDATLTVCRSRALGAVESSRPALRDRVTGVRGGQGAPSRGARYRSFRSSTEYRMMLTVQVADRPSSARPYTTYPFVSESTVGWVPASRRPALASTPTRSSSVPMRSFASGSGSVKIVISR